MNTKSITSHRLGPWLAIAAVLILAIVLLRLQGRLWICSCGEIYFWVGDIWSSDNSQHLFDPYSFTHLLHGVVFWAVLTWTLPRLAPMWTLWIAVVIESMWEVAENSAFIINRYREATASLGYTGDTIVNSMGDIFICAVGFGIALYLGFRRSLILFVLTELILIFWIRDSLLLSILMLVYPIEAIKAWQLGL